MDRISLPEGLFTSTTRPVDGQCVVHLFGAEINTASFAMYTFSISVLIQSLLIISISASADHGNYRKKLLLFFAFIGSTATMLFLVVVPKIYILGALLAIISNTCFGASFVLLNSFLPLLVRHHPSVQKPSRDRWSAPRDSQGTEPDNSSLGGDEIDLGCSSESLLAISRAGEMLPSKISKHTSPELRLSTQISSYGIGIGYIAALVVQTLAIFIILIIKYVSDSDTIALRVVLFFVGLWWLLFTIPAALWLRPRPGPPLSFTSDGRQIRGWGSYIAYAWRSLGKTIVKARRLKDISLFLVAWFLLSDSIATVSGTAILFAKTQLHMEPPALALINVIATLSGVIGAFSWSKLSQLFNARPSQTIVACICLFEIVPLYGLLGFIPAIQKLHVFGLQQPWEMYPLGAVYGFVLGGLSSYCRAVFGGLIPPGSEAAFYALYAITDKGSSIFGPAIVGVITDRYGDIRPAFVFLAVLIFLPLPLMTLVNVDRGRRDGVAIAKELRGNRSNSTSHTNTDGTISLVDEEAHTSED
jgi:MFS transporter, UMF1 family